MARKKPPSSSTEREVRWSMKLWPRLLAVAVALFLGWRLKEANKEIPFKTASRTNQTWGQYDLKQVLDELGVTVDRFVYSMPALKLWIERDGQDEVISRGLTELAPSEALSPRHPVVIVPGVTNTPLTLYKGRKCAESWLRNRLWGSVAATARFFTSNSSCFIEHLSLDEDTGLDPCGIRVRATQDIASIETVFGLDMWKMLVDKLVAIGYDSNNLMAMPYDWRLAAADTEQRDGYFSRLRLNIEFLYDFHHEKVAILTHSFGGTVLHHFMHWVEKVAGRGWVEKRVALVAGIGVPHLGVPKALSALLSGETKDTVGLGGIGVRMGDYVVPRKLRMHLIRSWGSIMNMLPKGGKAVWGSVNSAVDGDALDKCAHTPEGDLIKHGAFFTLKRQNGTLEELDVEAAARLLLEKVPAGIKERIRRHGSLRAGIPGFEGISPDLADAITSPLPQAPSLRYLCLYGVDVPTERRYHYRDVGDSEDPDELGTDITMDASMDRHDHCTHKGVCHGNGDASVPIISLGLMCRKWAERGFVNPSGVHITTVEFPRNSAVQGLRFDLRGGPDAVDHLSIMGNEKMLNILATAVAGHAHTIEDAIFSNIGEIAANIKIDANGARFAAMPLEKNFRTEL